MASFNKVVLLGNLTRDPELRYTPKGTAVAKLGLAVNRVWTNEAGERKEEVTFVDVDVFGRTAENAGQYLRKGRPVLVEGRLKMDQWEDKTTRQKKSRLGVVAEMIQFLGSSQESGVRSQNPEGKVQDESVQADAPVESQQAPPDGPPENDDVPFN